MHTRTEGNLASISATTVELDWPPNRLRAAQRIAPLGLLLFLLLPAGCGLGASRKVRANAGTPNTPATQPIMGRHLDAKGVPNFGQVAPTLYRGGQPSAQGMETLSEMGINIIVDTGRSKRDEALVKKLGMTYVSLPWYCPLPKDKVFDRFVELVRQHPDRKIFVHCRFGDDRTGMMIAAYRMAQDGWTAKQAMREMHEFGYGPLHHLTCPGLARYERSFPDRLQTDPVFDNLR